MDSLYRSSVLRTCFPVFMMCAAALVCEASSSMSCVSLPSKAMLRSILGSLKGSVIWSAYTLDPDRIPAATNSAPRPLCL